MSVASSDPLIDAHAHFYHRAAGRADWADVNAARMRAGDAIGVTYHVASVLGSYGFSSPTYFPSPDDVRRGNDAMLEICAAEPDRVRMFVTVNPNYTAHALAEIERCVARANVAPRRRDRCGGDRAHRVDNGGMDEAGRSRRDLACHCTPRDAVAAGAGAPADLSDTIRHIA